MSDETVQTVRRRIEHVESTIKTVEEHLDDEADSRALVQVLGSLEQIEADLDGLEIDSSDGGTGQND